MSDELPSLDALLTRALAKHNPKAPRGSTSNITAKQLAEADRRMRARFTAPENWERKRTIVLVHDESDTLLGNFAEWVHKLTAGCRKLQRVDTPTKIDAIERVSGEYWLAAPLQMHSDGTEARRAEEERDAIIDIHLPEMDSVFAPAVMVSVKLLWGGVSEVRLAEDTRFYSKDRRVQLILPDGMDVLEGMSLDSKLKLREFLGL